MYVFLILQQANGWYLTFKKAHRLHLAQSQPRQISQCPHLLCRMFKMRLLVSSEMTSLAMSHLELRPKSWQF